MFHHHLLGVLKCFGLLELLSVFFSSPSGRFGELFIFEAGPVSGLICVVCDLLSGSVILEIHEALIPISTRLLQ